MRSTKTIHVMNAKPGQILAQDIYHGNKDYSLIAPKNLRLSPYIIRRLISLDVDKITIFNEEYQTEVPVAEKLPTTQLFKENYTENAQIVKDVLNDLAVGKKLEMDTLTPVFDAMYQQVSQNYSLIDCINEIREADAYTYHHSLNVSLYAGLIATWMNLPEAAIQDIIQAGVLHDTGKSKIPQEILTKKGPLSEQEFEMMKKHSIYGYQLIKDAPGVNEDISLGVLMHHEKNDGQGYPLGLEGKKIHPYAKIIAIADVYDALTSERSYKHRLTPFNTFEELQQIGYSHFDPKVIITFLDNITSYYIGAKVQLNTGETGEIIAILSQSISKPIIKLNDQMIDLSQEPNYTIEKML